MWWQILEAWKQVERARQEDIKFQGSLGYTARGLILKLKGLGMQFWECSRVLA